MEVPRAELQRLARGLAERHGDARIVLRALVTGFLPWGGWLLARGARFFRGPLWEATAAPPAPAGLPPLPDVAALPAWLGAAYEALLELDDTRRRSGGHHTEPEVARDVVRRALAPLAPTEVQRVCDPAMGSGVFLIEAARALAVRARSPLPEVIAQRIFGFDLDPLAVGLAQLGLWAAAGAREGVARALAARLSVRDFTAVWRDAPEPFDVVVGNPPWVAFMGRAAQPITPATWRSLKDRFASFAGYPTLHGVFVERSVAILRPGGRLGLVLPTSMADLDGYAPARRAHDRDAEADAELPDYGARAFAGVFQPAMGLVSTRCASARAPSTGPWPLARDDLAPAFVRLCALAEALPALAPTHFAERGYQTDGRDKTALARGPGPGRVALSCGADVTPFRLLPATYWALPEALSRRLRPPEEWRAVDVLIRQTARYPIACRSDGRAFRNSVLAGFAGGLPPDGLVAYLNSAPVRCLHYHRFRDARQGMPQLKIAHLRRTPAPPTGDEVFHALAALAPRGAAAQAEIDALVCEAWGLPEALRAAVASWSVGAGALPRSRRRGESV